MRCRSNSIFRHRANKARKVKSALPDFSFVFGGTIVSSNTVQTLGESADLATVIAKINELILALRK